ncbi:lactonase family protein [Paenibacillus athensensis]|nr:lactonase family protein [Paenibacillus athensensis]MCD1258312.1 lactonase family protein [Paenibacillus athensensis]
MKPESTSTLRLYVGTYTDPERPLGIGLCEFDLNEGRLRLTESYPDIENPSFLTLSADRSRLYAVSETETYEDQEGGAVAAFAVEPASGRLTPLGMRATHGGAPCHVSLDGNGRLLMVANYMGGSVTVFPLEADGSLGEQAQLLRHEGALGPNAERQEAPHAHSALPDPANRFALAADLGLDRLLVAEIDGAARRLKPCGAAALAPGDGPRHFVFSADGRFVYLVNELSCTVTALAYDAEAGRLDAVQSLSTLPEGFSGENTCADIHLSADGRFLYASNRGHDSIALFAVDEADGRLRSIGFQPTLGRTPRNFALAPGGGFLLVANQDTDNITVFRVDAATGLLTDTGHALALPRPVCLVFA